MVKSRTLGNKLHDLIDPRTLGIVKGVNLPRRKQRGKRLASWIILARRMSEDYDCIPNLSRGDATTLCQAIREVWGEEGSTATYRKMSVAKDGSELWNVWRIPKNMRVEVSKYGVFFHEGKVIIHKAEEEKKR